ncbi:hypothetical protein ACH4FX_11275 [Streptomyces sp. NPDC018019]|uniref:hypothetical protein n=1 Tax=Streptomyces sp. NPDC018019 TaxID=3365030 RepID=UPI0037ADEDDA
MTILRRHLSSGFTVLPNSTLNDERLSFRARGILAWLISKPDNWQVRITAIAAAGKEGREAVAEAVRELKRFGYYRVVTERGPGGRFVRFTEVYDTAQDWAAEEYEQLEVRRLSRKLAKKLESEAQDPSATEDGFPGVGSPGVGSPEAGAPGVLGSNHNQHLQKEIPPTPAADAAGEPLPGGGGEPASAAVEVEGMSSRGCAAHRDVPGRSCRACGTSPRAQREAEKRAERERVKRAERAANESTLAEVRSRPGGDGLSEVARRRIEEMRKARQRAVDECAETGVTPPKNRPPFMIPSGPFTGHHPWSKQGSQPRDVSDYWRPAKATGPPPEAASRDRQ